MKRGMLFIVFAFLFSVFSSYFVSAYDFGGIVAGIAPCPDLSYTRTQILGGISGFRDIYVCYKDPGTGSAPFFGGIFILNPDTGGTIRGNPLNGGPAGCPAGYEDKIVGNLKSILEPVAPLDMTPKHELHYCQKTSGSADYTFEGLTGYNSYWNCASPKGKEIKEFSILGCLGGFYFEITATSDGTRSCDAGGQEFDEVYGLLGFCSKKTAASEVVVYQPQWLDDSNNPIGVGVFGKNVKLSTTTQNIVDGTDLRFDVRKEGSPDILTFFTVKVTSNKAGTTPLSLNVVANKDDLVNGGKEGDKLVIKGIARDSDGNLIESAFSQSLYIDQSPTASISAPANGATFTEGAKITITTTANDLDGALIGDRVTKVEFFNGAIKLWEDTNSADGWSFEWNSVPVGTYTLTAKATDNYGATGTSGAITIYVNNCGNNIKEGSEQCDDGANNGACPKTCSTSCTLNNCDSPGAKICGDGIVQNPNDAGIREECDGSAVSACATTKTCQSNCICDPLFNSCDNLPDNAAQCDGNPGIAGRDSAKGINLDPICYDAFYECKIIEGVCRVDSKFKNKNPLPSGCSPIGGGGNDPVPCCIGGEVTSTSACVDGFKTVTISYRSTDPSCGADVCPTTKTVPCGRNVAFLPFIGIWQIVAAIIVIGVIYYFMFKEKGKKR